MDQSEIAIPSDADEVTPAWLSAILGCEVIPDSVSITLNAHEGKGYLSNLLRVHCKKQDAQEQTHLIIKLLPQDPFMRDIVVGQEMDKTEIISYQTIIPELCARVPELASYICPFVFGKFTPDSGNHDNYRSVLVLQDLKQFHYFTLDFGENLNREQISDGIDFLAKVHFAGALLEEENGKPLTSTFPLLIHDIGTKLETFQTWIQEYTPTVLEMLNKSNLPKEMKQAYNILGNKLGGLMKNIFDKLSNFPALLHGDLWTNNILYNKDPGQHTKVIDWQLLMYRDATVDFGVFVTTSIMQDKLTIEGIEELVKDYYNLFEKFCKDRGVTHLIRRSYSEFYNFFKTYGLAFSLVWFVLSGVAFRDKNDARLIRTYEYFYEVGVVKFLIDIKSQE